MYDIIKKQNGERFAKAIRNYDNGIFDIPNLDSIVRYAGRDAEPIMQYLISLKNVEIQEHAVHMDPIALLNQAGYNAYIADTLKKQNAIRPYFAPGEELCTFRDSKRFENYYIINAVRKDVDKIRRRDFNNPQREDAYGTSVLSIQILKTGGFISIKNRYNHSVSNPDNTLNSNPDNIILGLSDALKHHFNVDFSSQKVSLPNRYIDVNGQILKYNTERNNVYFGDKFYMREGKIYDIDPYTEWMLGDGLLLNLQKHEVYDMSVTDYSSFSMEPTSRDLFIKVLNDAIRGKKLHVAKNPDGGHDIIADGVRILTVDGGEIVNINMPNAPVLDLTGFSRLRGNLDFSNVDKLYIGPWTDVSQVTDIKFNPNAHIIEFNTTPQIKLQGELDFSNVDVLQIGGPNMGDVSDIRFNPNASTISIGSAVDLKLHGDLDFSNVTKLFLSANVDASGVSGIKLNPDATDVHLSAQGLRLFGDVVFNNINLLRLEYIDFANVSTLRCDSSNSGDVHVLGPKNLRGTIDFSGTNHLLLTAPDLTHVSDLKFNPKASSIDCVRPIGLRGTFDLSGVSRVRIDSADLANARIKFNPNGKSVMMNNCKGLNGDVDLSHVVEFVSMSSSDISRANVRLNPRTAAMELIATKGLRGTLDFSGVKQLMMPSTDISDADVKFNPTADYICVQYVKGLRGELDFSRTKQLLINGADLSNVTAVHVNPGQLMDIDPNALQLRVGRNKLQIKILELQQKINKAINAVMGQQNE